VTVTAVDTLNAQKIYVSQPVTFSANTGVFTNYSGVAPDLGAIESIDALTFVRPDASIDWLGSSVGTFTTNSSFSSLTSWRMEMRLHGLTARSGREIQYNQYVWILTGFGSISLSADASRLTLQNLGENNNAYCWVSLNGTTDVVVRAERSGNSQPYTFKVWNSMSGMPLTTIEGCGNGGPHPVDLSDQSFTLGGTSWNTQNYEGAMAFARFYTAPDTSTTMPGSTSGADLLGYEFENSSKLGEDSSGNSPARNLQLLGNPIQIPTP
jgi:hypothetical protein